VRPAFLLTRTIPCAAHTMLMMLFRRLSSNRIPHEHALKDAELDTTAAAGPRNPFLYDPRRKAQAAKTKPSVVQNETTEVYVTLQNPFLFELEIQSIELR